MAPINSSPLYWAITGSVGDGSARDGRRIRGQYNKEQQHMLTLINEANKVANDSF